MSVEERTPHTPGQPRVMTDLQMQALLGALQSLPGSIRAELRAGMADLTAELTSEANIDRMVGIALQRLQGRAVETAGKTMLQAFKAAASHVLQIVGLLSLAYLVGGRAAVAHALEWLRG